MEIKNSYTNSPKIKYKSPVTPSFQGITSKVSKAIYDKNEIYELCNEYETKFNGIVGKPPADWVFSIPFDKRPEKIKELYANFGKIFSELRGQANIYWTRRSVQNKLKHLLKQTGIVKNQKQVKLSYTDSGSFGDVYKLDVKDESFAVKVYHALFQTGWTYHDYNGNYFEQPAAQYLKKKIPKKHNNWFNFYFGDLYNGIMVSKFENGDYPFDGKPFNTQKIGLSTTREHYSEKNILEGRILDIGMVDIWPHAKNKTMRYVYAKTMNDQQAPFKVLKKTLKWKPSEFYNERGSFKVIFRNSFDLSSEQVSMQVGDQNSMQVSEQAITNKSINSTVSEQVSVQVEGQNSMQVSEQVSVQVSEQVSTFIFKYKELLEYCKTPKSAKEIRDYLQLKSRNYVNNKILKPLIRLNLLEYTNKQKINSSNQKYITKIR